MLTKLSLRLRIFLFFLFLALAGIAIVTGALYIGHRRTGGDPSGYIFSAILSGFGLLGVSAGIWLLFDENVAKPIERLAAAMRTRAHAGVDVALNENEARYLGDLAPATQAVTGQLSQSTMDAAEAVASETARLAAEKERLTALLTEIPMAMVLVNAAHQITLYDGQAAQILGQVHVPRLNASIFEYFREEDVMLAHAEMHSSGAEVSLTARGTQGRLTFDARLKPLAHAPGYMLLIDDTHASIDADAARPLIYDFDLGEQASEHAIEDTPIDALTYMVFDTETTGLQPNKDEIVQIGAVRVVNGRIIPGECIDQLVNPGMPIPPASTKVHKVSDAMVADAPDIHLAAGHLHTFSQNSVIVAHNAPFDMAFLRRHGKRSGLDWTHPILDTVLLSAVLFGASETHTLDALCDRLGVTIPEELRHTALGDAQATAEVLCLMLPMLASRGFKNFGQVISQTRKHGRLLQDLN
ncbi:exonuclease domain-containing protein [Alisedimentitalea sp. MJ-SS2]|uniref:3'-5' exonuclease n=1 Tax=Aliisedimentitalea sp. MJ-SS2 TaxID=3049795 RepID=UPI00290BD7A3|nr:exonuclease domain-containing protein [Alisedimentitalea sp. MJ-SS2]MDU8928187.1 exonuclease domain-containing protein [Alisedimentitalea sp. MJ-SS2]